MDVVFEGALSKSWGMKDVLQAISELPNVQTGLLRIFCASRSVQGKILFAQSRHILGASCSGVPLSNEAYDSLKALLEVTEGNFAFLDLSGEPVPDVDQSLFIDINAVLQSWPQLPENSSELFDQIGLLDRVFGQSSVQQVQDSQPQAQIPVLEIEPQPEPAPRKEQAAPITRKSSAAPITQWNVVESLFNNPQAAHTERAHSPLQAGSMIPHFVQTADEQRSSMNRLRALPESSAEAPQWQRFIKQQQAIKWLLAALGLSFLVFLLGQQMSTKSPAQNQRIAAGSSLSTAH